MAKWTASSVNLFKTPSKFKCIWSLYEWPKEPMNQRICPSRFQIFHTSELLWLTPSFIWISWSEQPFLSSSHLQWVLAELSPLHQPFVTWNQTQPLEARWGKCMLSQKAISDFIMSIRTDFTLNHLQTYLSLRRRTVKGQSNFKV